MNRPAATVGNSDNMSNTYNHTRYTLAVLGLLLVPLHFLFTITADEQGEKFLVRLWNTIRSVIILITVSLSLQLHFVIESNTRSGRFGGKLREAFLPNDSWGPSSIKERREWQVTEMMMLVTTMMMAMVLQQRQ